jgi:hypothetical protein
MIGFLADGGGCARTAGELSWPTLERWETARHERGMKGACLS